MNGIEPVDLRKTGLQHFGGRSFAALDEVGGFAQGQIL